MKGQALKAWP